MKKVLLLLLLLLAVPAASMAQEMREVVYLKNGSIIKGMIIEFVPGQSLKIQTADGSVFAYEMSEVEKIAKEALPISHNRSGSAVEWRGYRGFFDVGYTIGTSDYWGDDRVEFSTTHGYQFNPYFFLGVGVGANWFYDSEFVEIPIFLDVRAGMLKWPVSPFVDVKVGYSVYDDKGFYFAPTVGCRFGVGQKVGLNFGLGYTVQMCDVVTVYSRYIRTKTENVGGFHIKLGVDF